MAVTARLWGNTADLTSTESPAFTPAILANSVPGRVPAIPLPDDQLERFEQGQAFAAGNATYIPNQIDPDGNRLSSFFSGTGSFQHVVSDTTTYRIAYQGVDTRRGYEDGPGGPGQFEPFSTGTGHFNGRTDTVQARVDRRAGTRNFITAGYEFMREKYFSFDDTPTDDTQENAIALSQRSHAIYAQDQIQLGGQLVLTLSGRMQFFSLDQPEFSGTAGNPYEGNIGTVEAPNAYTGDVSVAYFVPTPQTKLRVHAGNSYRAPSLYERFGGGFGSYYGDPRLEPERAVSVDGGVDQWLFESKLQLSGTLFWTELQEAIRFENTLPADDPFERFFGYANGGGGSARGVELSAHVSPTGATQAQVSYTYANSESEVPTFGTDYFEDPQPRPSHVRDVGDAVDHAALPCDVRSVCEERLRHGPLRRLRPPVRVRRADEGEPRAGIRHAHRRKEERRGLHEDREPVRPAAVRRRVHRTGSLGGRRRQAPVLTSAHDRRRDLRPSVVLPVAVLGVVPGSGVFVPDEGEAGAPRAVA